MQVPYNFDPNSKNIPVGEEGEKSHGHKLAYQTGGKSFQKVMERSPQQGKQQQQMKGKGELLPVGEKVVEAGEDEVAVDEEKGGGTPFSLFAPPPDSKKKGGAVLGRAGRPPSESAERAVVPKQPFGVMVSPRQAPPPAPVATAPRTEGPVAEMPVAEAAEVLPPQSPPEEKLQQKPQQKEVEASTVAVAPEAEPAEKPPTAATRAAVAKKSAAASPVATRGQQQDISREELVVLAKAGHDEEPRSTRAPFFDRPTPPPQPLPTAKRGAMPSPSPSSSMRGDVREALPGLPKETSEEIREYAPEVTERQQPEGIVETNIDTHSKVPLYRRGWTPPTTPSPSPAASPTENAPADTPPKMVEQRYATSALPPSLHLQQTEEIATTEEPATESPAASTSPQQLQSTAPPQPVATGGNKVTDEQQGVQTQAALGLRSHDQVEQRPQGKEAPKAMPSSARPTRTGTPTPTTTTAVAPQLRVDSETADDADLAMTTPNDSGEEQPSSPHVAAPPQPQSKLHLKVDVEQQGVQTQAALKLRSADERGEEYENHPVAPSLQKSVLQKSSLFEYVAPSHEQQQQDPSGQQNTAKGPRTLNAEAVAEEKNTPSLTPTAAVTTPLQEKIETPKIEMPSVGPTGKEIPKSTTSVNSEIPAASKMTESPQQNIPTPTPKKLTTQATTSPPLPPPTTDIPSTAPTTPKTEQHVQPKENEDDDVLLDPRAVALAGQIPQPQHFIAIETPLPPSAPPPPLPPNLQKIVDQIVKEIYTVTSDGQTDVVIELGEPPLFEGVKVTVSSFKDAPGQVNVVFSGMTSRGQAIIEAHRENLRMHLEHNVPNLTVQDVSATTVEVPHYTTESGRQPRERHGGDGRGNDGGSNGGSDSDATGQQQDGQRGGGQQKRSRS